MNCKKLTLSILTIFGGMLPFISFGANETGKCLTCGSSPKNLVLINNFTTEIIANIRTIGTKDPYVGKQVPPSRFDTGKFIPPKQSILSKTLRRARELVESTLAIKRINLEVSDVINVGDAIGVLSKNRAFLRDRQKLNKIEQDINKKKYELSVGGGRTDKIAGVSFKKITDIIKKYQDLGILSPSTTIEAGAEYGDLIMLIGRTNSSLKHLVGLGGENRSSTEQKRWFYLFTQGKIAIKIEDKAIDEIQYDYTCTKRYACDQSWTNLKGERKNIMDNMKKGMKNAQSEITKANQRLTTAYSKKNLKKTITEQKLWTQLSGTLNDMKNRRKKSDTPKKATESTEKSNIILKPNISSSQSKDTIKANFEARIFKTEKSIDKDADNMAEKYTTTDISDSLQYFVLLSDKMTTITNNLVGSKDSSSSCLIKNLGALCEKQCSNIGNKACYY